MRVLICDDDKSFRESLVDFLNADGFQTYEAGRGYDAIRIARRVPVDFGFFDFRLPDLDGPSTVKRLREESISFPCVLMSGETFSIETVMGAGGFVTFVRKPPDLSTIREIMYGFFGSPPRERKA